MLLLWHPRKAAAGGPTIVAADLSIQASAAVEFVVEVETITTERRRPSWWRGPRKLRKREPISEPPLRDIEEDDQEVLAILQRIIERLP